MPVKGSLTRELYAPRVRTNQDPTLLKALAGEVKARRLRLGLSQEGSAHTANLNRTFVAKLELAQTSPSLTSLFQLAQGLETAPEELVAEIAKRHKRELASVATLREANAAL